MRISKVYYQRNFRLGTFLFETVGVGIEVNEGEDAKQALDEAKRLTNEYGETMYEEAESMRGTHETLIHAASEPTDKIASWMEVIRLCSTITALQRFEKQVEREQNQELTNAYNEKLKQLQ